MESEKPDWLKGRGYVHITPKINFWKKGAEYLSKVTNPGFVEKHSFFPLIHYTIKERKYKKHPHNPLIRVHSYKDKDKFKQTAKHRPIHFATHEDALIFAYYGDELGNKYNRMILEKDGLADCIIAYRKIPINPNDSDSKGKSTIHFAKEAFQKIEEMSSEPCAVLMFDIKSFFSRLDHAYLKKLWIDLLGCTKKLPKDHYKVFNAATNFSYLLRDELRAYQSMKGKRSGFDEKNLAKIRQHHGKEAYFHSLAEFRAAIKNKKIKVYKRQFMEKGIPVGIPQGLPISSVLANLYLYKFDLAIFEKIVKGRKGYYRRYSDDILIICKPDEMDDIKKEVDLEILNCCLELSKDKTESFIFKQHSGGKTGSRLTCFQQLDDGSERIKPLTYLGFHFYGYQTRIKSGNIAKFHRKTIDAVKRKTKRIEHLIEKQPHGNSAIFVNQVRKISTSIKKDSEIKKRTGKYLKINELGIHNYKISEFDPQHRSNYISYVRKVTDIFQDGRIYKQIGRRRTILHEALFRHYKCRLEKKFD